MTATLKAAEDAKKSVDIRAMLVAVITTTFTGFFTDLGKEINKKVKRYLSKLFKGTGKKVQSD